MYDLNTGNVIDAIDAQCTMDGALAAHGIPAHMGGALAAPWDPSAHGWCTGRPWAGGMTHCL